MKTLIKVRNTYEMVTNHKEPLPLNDDLSVNYDKFVERIDRVWPDKVKRDLTKVF